MLGSFAIIFCSTLSGMTLLGQDFSHFLPLCRSDLTPGIALGTNPFFPPFVPVNPVFSVVSPFSPSPPRPGNPGPAGTV